MTRRFRPAVVLVLLALFVAQLAAQAHVLTHSRTDPTDLPERHTQLCTECASFAPLLVTHGGTAAPPAVEPRAVESTAATAASAAASLRCHHAFRSRAPPA